MSTIMKHNGVVYSALTPNMKGFHTAVSTSKSTCQGMAGFKLMKNIRPRNKCDSFGTLAEFRQLSPLFRLIVLYTAHGR